MKITPPAKAYETPAKLLELVTHYIVNYYRRNTTIMQPESNLFYISYALTVLSTPILYKPHYNDFVKTPYVSYTLKNIINQMPNHFPYNCILFSPAAILGNINRWQVLYPNVSVQNNLTPKYTFFSKEQPLKSQFFLLVIE